MNIKVITRHYIPNYGSLLQSYATVKLFESMNCNCQIIDYRRIDEKGINLGKTLLKSSNWNNSFLKRNIYRLVQYPLHMHAYYKFQKNINDYLGNYLTVECNDSSSIKNICNDSDILCSGSDQIWGRVGGEEYDENYFLSFANNNKCISLSSSFGKDVIGEKLNANLGKLLENYSFISVREKSAKKILDDNHIKSEVFLDPTMLVDKKLWIGLCNKSEKENYILVYQLHDNKIFNKYLDKIAKKEKLKVIRICTSFHQKFKYGKGKYLPSIQEFLSLVFNAKYVVTDSFHCTVFSILFHKQFCTYLPNDTNTRIINLLEFTGLKEQILNDSFDDKWMGQKINWKNVDEVIKTEQLKNINMLNDAIKGNCNNIKIVSNCTGCRCCEKICPKNAISFKKNSEGFLYPLIDDNKCINCGLCVKRCPQNANTLEIKNENQKVYGVYSKEKDDLYSSSSGGMFINLCRYIIQKNGIVFGARYDNFKVLHEGTTTLEGCFKFQKSKYLQSDVNDTYFDVKNALESSKLVLYSGTPCQIAGLKNFLKKDYSNLVTVDLICHGVPSEKMFNDYIKYLEKKYKGKVLEYDFRTKNNNNYGEVSRVLIRSNNKCRNVYVKSTFDPYYDSFIKGKILRDACYSCKYANINRVSDITIGDFWGIEKVNSKFGSSGNVSMVIINTAKGMEVFNQIKDCLCYFETTSDDVKNNNRSLIEPMSKDNKVYNIYDDSNPTFENIIKKLDFKITLKERIKGIIPRKVKNRVKKVLLKRRGI